MLAQEGFDNFKLRELKQLWLHLTYSCNLSCYHCLFRCSPEKEAVGLSLEAAQKYVREGLVLGVKEVYITGGEPLLWTNLTKFLEWYFWEAKLPLTILTNGTLIDRAWAQKLATYSSRGLQLRISLECYTELTNDRWRGAGSFSRTINGIKLLNEKKIRPWIAYTNKTGGSLESGQAAGLEHDFVASLKREYGVEIAGLKVISAYAKGRHEDQLKLNNSFIGDDKLATIQCGYGLAVSSRGVAPCPVLVDIPDCNTAGSLAQFLGRAVDLSYSYCQSCLATGTTCGN